MGCPYSGAYYFFLYLCNYFEFLLSNIFYSFKISRDMQLMVCTRYAPIKRKLRTSKVHPHILLCHRKLDANSFQSNSYKKNKFWMFVHQRTNFLLTSHVNLLVKLLAKTCSSNLFTKKTYPCFMKFIHQIVLNLPINFLLKTCLSNFQTINFFPVFH